MEEKGNICHSKLHTVIPALTLCDCSMTFQQMLFISDANDI